MYSDQCEDQSYFDSYEECTSFLSGVVGQGLHSTIVRYVKDLQVILSNYEELKAEKGYSQGLMLEIQESLQSLYILQKYFQAPAFRHLVSTLNDSFAEDIDIRMGRRIAVFFSFVIGLLGIYLVVWLRML